MPNGKKLKVGLVFDDTLDSADGVAQYVKTLGGWLSRQGHEVRYLVGETKIVEWQGGKVYSLSRNVSVRFNGNRLSIPGLSSRRRIKEVLNEEQFDVLHIMVPYSPLMAGRVMNLASKDTAIVGTFHIFPAGFLSRAGSRLLRLVLARSIGKFNALVAVSQASAEFARQAYGLDPGILPNTIDTSRFARKNSQPQTDIVFLGRLVERKGCLELLKAFKLLKSDARLKIAGKGAQMNMLKDYVKDNNLAGKVEFVGFVSEEEKARLLANAAIACFPSLYGEAFGIVLIEAMAAGAGVVLGGDNPGYRSVLGEQETLLINPKNTKAFAERLDQLLQDERLAAQLHSWQADAVKQYDVNVVGKKLMNIYARSIALKNKNGHNETDET